MPKILLIEDDLRIIGFVKRGLEAEGYSVDVAELGAHGLELARDGQFSVIILDRMLPDMEGIEVCRHLRATKIDVFILMLTAMDGLQDKIAGLKSGADDYLTKPFAFDELLARIAALIRRTSATTPDRTRTVADLKLDPVSKQVWRSNRQINLTAKEFKLLSYLMDHPGAVISRTRLLNNVWDLSFDPETKVVDVYIRYLRRKLEIDGAPQLIKTVRGFGYVISP